jgi:hypothetical protein
VEDVDVMPPLVDDSDRQVEPLLSKLTHHLATRAQQKQNNTFGAERQSWLRLRDGKMLMLWLLLRHFFLRL